MITMTPDAQIDSYPELLSAVRATFATRAHGPLFTTDAGALAATYLQSLPAEQQRHDCRTCAHFFTTYGGLATIGEGGTLTPVFWDPAAAPAFYRPAAAALADLVTRANVTGVFVTDRQQWGIGVTGDWTHFSVVPPTALLYTGRIHTPSQRAAELREDYRTLSRALGEIALAQLETALRVLEADALSRAEKVVGLARWLRDLQAARTATQDVRRREALTWRAVATAPPGFCHPRSSMIGTLLEDIAAGLSFEEVRARWEAKMHPLRYQRPQARPAAGNIGRAEKLVEQLGLAPALRRRYARLDEVEAIWRPTATPEPRAAAGVFGHLEPKGRAAQGPQLDIPVQTMTWVKFAATVLPTVQRLELFVPGGLAVAFVGLVTAVDPDAPPLLQWDRPERRNPVSWYLWHNGSYPAQWGLAPTTWQPVSAVALKPPQWYGGQLSHHGEGAIMILEAARDSRWEHAGLALFPETLRAELHAVRSTIEAFSRSGRLEGAEAGNANGLLLQKGQPLLTSLQAHDAGGVRRYVIDRWD